jgi:hypothetical protein
VLDAPPLLVLDAAPLLVLVLDAAPLLVLVLDAPPLLVLDEPAARVAPPEPLEAPDAPPAPVGLSWPTLASCVGQPASAATPNIDNTRLYVVIASTYGLPAVRVAWARARSASRSSL